MERNRAVVAEQATGGAAGRRPAGLERDLLGVADKGHHGVPCPRSTVLAGPATTVSSDGVRPVSGIAFWQR